MSMFVCRLRQWASTVPWHVHFFNLLKVVKQLFWDRQESSAVVAIFSFSVSFSPIPLPFNHFPFPSFLFCFAFSSLHCRFQLPPSPSQIFSVLARAPAVFPPRSTSVSLLSFGLEAASLFAFPSPLVLSLHRNPFTVVDVFPSMLLFLTIKFQAVSLRCSWGKSLAMCLWRPHL